MPGGLFAMDRAAWSGRTMRAVFSSLLHTSCEIWGSVGVLLQGWDDALWIPILSSVAKQGCISGAEPLLSKWTPQIARDRASHLMENRTACKLATVWVSQRGSAVSMLKHPFPLFVNPSKSQPPYAGTARP